MKNPDFENNMACVFSGVGQKPRSSSLTERKAPVSNRRGILFHCGENEIRESFINSSFVGATPTPATICPVRRTATRGRGTASEQGITSPVAFFFPDTCRLWTVRGIKRVTPQTPHRKVFPGAGPNFTNPNKARNCKRMAGCEVTAADRLTVLAVPDIDTLRAVSEKLRGTAKAKRKASPLVQRELQSWTSKNVLSMSKSVRAPHCFITNGATNL